MPDTATAAAAVTRHAGIVKWFDPEKGWGFITPTQPIAGLNKADIFVHKRALKGLDPDSLIDGVRVSFVVGEHRAKPCAVEVHLEA